MLHYSRIIKSGFTSALALGMTFHVFGQQREVTTSVPKALRDDITIEEYMKVEPEAVRLIQHPITGEMYYTTFFGDVVKIVIEDGKPVSKKLLSVEDHGIPRLQGAAFHGN